MARSLPFFLLLGSMAFFSVYNVHGAQSTLRQIEEARAELQDLRWRASALQSEIMYSNKQSEVLRRMSVHDLGLAGSSPRRLVAPE